MLARIGQFQPFPALVRRWPSYGRLAFFPRPALRRVFPHAEVLVLPPVQSLPGVAAGPV